MNLRHKNYHIFNEPYSKEDYFKKLEEYAFGNYKQFAEAKRTFSEDLRKKFPVRAIYQVNCENCEGDNHKNSKNLKYCFDCAACEDCAYGFQMDETYDSMDMTCMGYDRSEVCYQTIGCSGIFNCLACDSCWHGNDLWYCNLCFQSKNCFGCISLQHGEYCILNKKYSKEEYESLMPKIVENMKENNEWGKFFPPKLSAFNYNETVAHEYMPITEEEATKKGYKWKAKDKREYKKQEHAIPEHIKDVEKSIINQVLACVECGKNYKITSAELKFYKGLGIPIPRECPDCRHRHRIKLRNPRTLWKQNCSECGIEIQTAYSPDRPEKVYCGRCYRKAVYE
ncbi:MAG: hypothetical protein ABH856_02040 [Patescibacteria group bacterium]